MIIQLGACWSRADPLELIQFLILLGLVRLLWLWGAVQIRYTALSLEQALLYCSSVSGYTVSSGWLAGYTGEAVGGDGSSLCASSTKATCLNLSKAKRQR